MKIVAGLYCLFATFAFLQSAGSLQKTGILEIHLTHLVNNTRLSPDSNYLNAFNEAYSIRRLKYYITNIAFVSSGSHKRVELADSYFLVDEGSEESKTIRLTLPEGNYDTLSLLLGVDSLHNVSGAQSGALDPMNGMFWTWNSGYVSIKFEGRSAASSLAGNLFEYHLGGYKGPDNVNQRIELGLPGSKLKVSGEKTAIVSLEADFNLFFSSLHSLPIKTAPACTVPGRLARQYAENYAKIFRIDSTYYK